MPHAYPFWKMFKRWVLLKKKMIRCILCKKIMRKFTPSFYIVQTPSGVYSYWRIAVQEVSIYVSKSDILGPNGNLSDIKNLVSIERETFKDSSYKYRIQKVLLFMSISPLWKTCLKHHKRCTCQLYGHYSLINKMVVILIR